MTSIDYSVAQAAPPTLGSPWAPAEEAEVRTLTRRAAAVPLAVCAAVQWVVLVAAGLPEVGGLRAGSWWLAQLGPLTLTAGHRVGALVLLGAAVALFVLSRTRHWVGRAGMMAPAVIGTLTGVAILVQLLLTGTTGSSVLGLILLAVWLVTAWYAGVHAWLLDLGPPPAPDRRSGLVLVIAWVVLLPGALALGRLLLAGDLRAEAQVLRANTVALRLSALLSSASLWLWLFGALLGVIIWLAYQCWPRRAVGRSWRWRTALVVAVLVCVPVWWSAQSSAAQRVTQLRYGTPADELRFTCGTWVYPPESGTSADTPTVTVAVNGAGCRTVSTFAGYRQVGSSKTNVSVSPVSLRAPAIGRDDTEDRDAAAPARVPLAGARYGDVLVLAGSSRFDRVADQLVAVSLTGGPPGQGREPAAALWRFTCGDKREVRAQFPGGQTEPGVAPLPTLGRSEPMVVLTCGAQRLRFDPATGLTP